MNIPNLIDRRDFIKTGALASGGIMLAPSISKAQSSANGRINLALLGFGRQGEVLTDSIMAITNSPVQIRAVCDIWDYRARLCKGRLRAKGLDINTYQNFEDMLATEKDLDAVVIATPDFWHARHTNACLEAGLNVYCEKMMARTPDEARSMVRTARETGKLLQIGHQRRSNPRYLHAYLNLIGRAELPGRITNVNGQWNRGVAPLLAVKEKIAIPQAELESYGFENMKEFLNWRWYRKYSGGPISDLGSHQIDIFNWFLDAYPKTVMASGSNDYYTDREWYDNVMVIYEYETAKGPVRAFYQTLSTTSAGGGYYEYFMGDEGALRISENPTWTKLFREQTAPNWDEWAEKNYIRKAPPPPREVQTKIDVRESAPPDAYDLPIVLDKFPHQPHLENFFKTIQGKAKLNSDGEHSFKSEMAIFRVNEAVEARKALEFSDEDFKV